MLDLTAVSQQLLSIICQQTWPLPAEIQLPDLTVSLQPLAGDASRKQFYRLRIANQTLILVKLPTDGKGSEEIFIGADLTHANQANYFIAVVKLIADKLPNTPAIFAADETAGLVLMADLGDVVLGYLLADCGMSETAVFVYEQMLAWISHLQQLQEQLPMAALPQKRLFEQQALQLELQEFLDSAICRGNLANLPSEQYSQFQALFVKLAADIVQQPVALIHRDLQSHNIMILDKRPFVIDTQDMCLGPATYDLASLLYDPNAQLSQEAIISLTNQFWEKQRFGTPLAVLSYEAFTRFLQLTALQRVAKAAGRYATLTFIRQKPQYATNFAFACRAMKRLLPQLSNQRTLANLIAKHLS